MIKLQSHSRKRNPQKFMRDLAIAHWDYLNKQNGSKISITMKVDHAIVEASTPLYLKNVAGDSLEVLKNQLLFLNSLKDNNYAFLKKIIISRPNELDKIRKNIFKTISKGCFIQKNTVLIKGVPTPKISQSLFGIWLTERIFNYTAFRKSAHCRETLIKMNFRSATCPYCNYGMIDIIDKATAKKVGGKEKGYFEADHFFQKYQHPFLALSFFNLIPSCHNCNAMDKGAIDFSLKTHVNPFSQSLDDIYQFRISAKEIFDAKIDEITVEYISRNIDQTFKDFNILAKYNVGGLESANRVLKKFLNNKHLAGTPEHASFIETIFDGIADKKNAILDFPKSKLHRDILRELDPTGALGIQYILSR